MIARLTFVLPFRSPTRALAMATLSKAQKAGLNPLDDAVDYYARGAFSFGDIKIPTWSLNPWQSLAPILDAIGDESPLGVILEESIGWAHPAIQAALSLKDGTNQFGQGIISQPGRAPYGADGPLTRNTVSGFIKRSKVRLHPLELALQTIAPAQVQQLRVWAEGEDKAWGDVTTAQLVRDKINSLNGHPRDESLYMPRRRNRGRTQTAINRFSKLGGLPIQRQSDSALVREARERERDLQREQRQLANARRRNQGR